jgi:hypothetical protein
MKPSSIDLDHRRHRTKRAIDWRKGRLWIDFLPSINLSSQIAQQGRAVRFARVAILQDGCPPLLHIFGQVTISRNHIPNLYQSPEDFVAEVFLIVHLARLVDVAWCLVIRRHVQTM